MKKINCFIILFFIPLLFINCKNDISKAKPSMELSVNKFKIEKIIQVNEDDAVFSNFKNSESFKILSSSLPKLNFSNIRKVIFSNSEVIGLQIDLPKNGNFTQELLIAYKIDNPVAVTTFIRKSSLINEVKNGNIISNGEVKFLNADLSLLNQMTIRNNKITDFKMSTSGERFSTKNAKFASIQSCTWQCTAEDFNCEVNAARNTCENDWQCNLVGNPIMYVAVAIIQCTVCFY